MTIEHLRLVEAQEAYWGLMRLPSGLELVTLELPWRDNKRNESCWPPGRHRCELTYSPHFKKKMYLVEVEGRSGMRIHVGNFARQLRGCLAVGRKVARFPSHEWGITNSGSSLQALMRELRGRPFVLDTRTMTPG